MSPTTEQPTEQPVTTEQAPPQPDLAALQKQIETLQSQVAENQRAAEFWHGKANEKPAPPAKPSEPEDIDLLDLITTKGPKGLDEYLASRGYVSKDQAQGMIESKAKELLSEQELMKQYPDLAPDKRDSEFFKATANEYGRLIKEGVPVHLAMNQAAANTELALLKAGRMKTTQHQADEKKAQREADRLARIAAQGSDRNARAPEAEEGDEEITPTEDRIIDGMLVGMIGADGKPMTKEQAREAYKKRANSGTIQVTPRSRK